MPIPLLIKFFPIFLQIFHGILVSPSSDPIVILKRILDPSQTIQKSLYMYIILQEVTIIVKVICIIRNLNQLGAY